MNKATFGKIRSATPFLLWFRWYLPSDVQALIRSHLDAPQQLALSILDSCHSSQPKRVREIAQMTGVRGETVRQVLLALREGGVMLEGSSLQGWRLLEGKPCQEATVYTQVLSPPKSPNSGGLPFAERVHSTYRIVCSKSPKVGGLRGL